MAILFRSYFRPYEVQAALALSESITYTTIRGSFKMGPIVNFGAFPVIFDWIDGEEPYGCYILRYGPGAEKTPHVDPTPGKIHDRIVVLLQAANTGGDIYIEGQGFKLTPGDAVFLRADLELHAITPVVSGERIVLTVGRIYAYQDMLT